MARYNVNDTRSIKGRKVDKKFVFVHLLRYLKPFWPILCLVFLANIASTMLSLVGPKLCGLAIDLIDPKGGTDFTKIIYYAIILIGVYALSAILEYLSAIGMSYVSRGTVKRMRSEVFAHLSKLPVSFFDGRQAGDIISVLSYDIDTVGESLANDVMIVLKSGVLIVGSLIMMLTIAPMLVLVFAVTVPLSIVMTRFIVGKVQPLFRKRSAKLGELNGFVEEITTGQKTTRAYGCEEKIISDFEVKNREAVDAYAKAEYYGTISGPSVGLINNISLTLVSVFGALMFMRGTISPGQISSFILYSRKFSGPINEIANIMGEFQSAIAAAERVFRVLEEDPEPADAERAEILMDVKGDVEIDHLNFGYVKDKTIIHDFSLSVESGQVVAIVGHTGAGKTTIINLLMRFYDQDGGSICIDGHDTRGLTRASVRRAFTMVLQDTWLFAGSVYDNIAYGNPSATREDVVRVCKAAKIHSFIERLPQGYDTILSENAVNISKGQKQLLTIARAMLVDSPMLILDEATSNVDTRTEQIIQDAMKELMKGKTCFVIAHRLSTIKAADKILVMRDGDVVEQGTHDTLIASGGYYSELYYSQFETV
ncbi:MAG: ABC transporter ATP-binding protein [Clostridiales bacterium]|nr:ABC transporter ATP-binding protein [Clostridiales bacterium]